MTSTQLFILSMQTCQWWNAVFIQADRFFYILENHHGGTPWDEEDANSLFVAERMFLIIAIHYAIENLRKLNIELQREQDFSLQKVLQTIENTASFSDIKNLRDMNEHSLDYLVDKGKNQEHFRSLIKKGDYMTLTTAAWTHVYGDEQVTFLGNVPIDKLILTMKNQLPIVRQKTKEIFDRELIGASCEKTNIVDRTE